MKIGFIGGSGHHFLRGALPGGKFEIAVAGDGRDDAAARRLGEQLGGMWFEDGRKMLDTFKPDVVSVGAVYAINGDWAAEALERDMPTVSDKPIAASWRQLDRLRALVSAKPDRVLLTEFGFRSGPEFQAARAAVREGRIGQPVLATGQKSYRFGTRPAWYADRSTYCGTLMWVASHAVDIIPFVTGQKLTRAIGHGGNVSKPAYGTMEDHVAAMFVLSGGGTALVHADFLRPAAAPTHGDDRLRVAGSEGVLEIMNDRCRLITNKEAEVDLTDQVKPRPVYEEMLAALQGVPSDLFSTSESLATAQLLLRVREAVDRSIWIDL